MIKKEKDCPYWYKEGSLEYQVCRASGNQCFCEGNGWYCDYIHHRDRADYNKHIGTSFDDWLKEEEDNGHK